MNATQQVIPPPPPAAPVGPADWEAAPKPEARPDEHDGAMLDPSIAGGGLARLPRPLY